MNLFLLSAFLLVIALLRVLLLRAFLPVLLLRAFLPAVFWLGCFLLRTFLLKSFLPRACLVRVLLLSVLLLKGLLLIVFFQRAFLLNVFLLQIFFFRRKSIARYGQQCCSVNDVLSISDVFGAGHSKDSSPGRVKTAALPGAPHIYSQMRQRQGTHLPQRRSNCISKRWQ